MSEIGLPDCACCCKCGDKAPEPYQYCATCRAHLDGDIALVVRVIKELQLKISELRGEQEAIRRLLAHAITEIKPAIDGLTSAPLFRALVGKRRV